MAASISTGLIGHAAAAAVVPMPRPVDTREARPPAEGDALLQWALKRNCSLAPRPLLLTFAGVALLSLAIAGGFWMLGATFVLPFAGLELGGLAIALLHYARHAVDAEHIVLGRELLTVLRIDGARSVRVDFRPDAVRVAPCRAGELIELSGQGRSIAVGRHVRPELRPRLAAELRAALWRWPRDGAPAA